MRDVIEKNERRKYLGYRNATKGKKKGKRGMRTAVNERNTRN